MTVLEKISFYQNCRDEVPNQELAKELTQQADCTGIQEIAENLDNPNPAIQSDCLKVLYEIGYLNPELIGAYCDKFLQLLHSKNNRLVWGAMIAISTIAPGQADQLYPHVTLIQSTMTAGSVITIDAGMKTLASVAAHKPEYAESVFPYLLFQLETCRAKDLPRQAEVVFPAVPESQLPVYISLLEKRSCELSPSQLKRINKLLTTAKNASISTGMPGS